MKDKRARKARLFMAMAAFFVMGGWLSQASAQVSVPPHEIDKSGRGGACVVHLLPRKQTGSNPPLLVIRTTGSSRNGEVYIEADFPASAGPVQLVYNNARTDFSAKRYASGKTLIESGFWAMLKAAENKDMAFFLTGRRLDGTYESARYSGISPLGVISILESQCGFSSSAISAKSSADLLADERALGISSDDMRHIRWVLNRQISSRRSAPPKGSTLTSTERGYLEQYARRNGLRASRYLTPELAQSLIRRRFLPLRSPPSSKPNYRRHSDWFSYQTSDRKACVTASFATSWTGAEFYVAPMMEYGARKSTSGNAIWLDMVSPNPFATSSQVYAMVDGRRYNLTIDDEDRVQPRRSGSGLDNTVIKAIRRGKEITIHGSSRENGHFLSITFSALGFTKSFNQIATDCNRRRIREWFN